MTNIKITDLTAYTDAASTDVLPIVDVVADVTKKIAISDVVKAVPQGTAALPGLAFDGDPDTGIYSPGADQIALVTAGTGRLFVNSTGTIQTNSAGQIESWSSAGSLTLYGGATSKGGGIKLNGGVADGNIIFYAQQQTATPAERLRITSTGTLMHIGAGNYITPAVQFNGSAPVDSLVVNSSGNVSTVGTMTADSFIPTSSTVPTNGVYLPSANNVAISTNGTGRLFINSAGVISHSLYDQWMHSNGSTIAGLIGRGVTLITGSAEDDLAIRGGGNVVFAAGSSSERMRLDTSGRLGLGTSAPGESLHTTGKIRVGDGGNYTVAAVQLGASNANGISYPNTNTLSFITNSTAAVTIDSSQRVGIGTTSPASGRALTLNGASNYYGLELQANGTSIGSLIQESTGLLYLSTTTSPGTLVFRSNNQVEAARIDSSGTFRVKGAGTAGTTDAVQLNGSAPANSLLLDASGRVLVGTSSTSEVSRAVFQGNSTASTGTSIVKLTLGNASPGSTDELGKIQFADSSHVTAAQIAGLRDGGTWNSGSRPSALVFSTTADGASSPTERMRIANNGNIDIGGAFSSGTRTLRLTPDVIQSSWDSTNSRTHQEFINTNGVVGSISTSGSATSFNTSSDYRLKENVVPLTGAANRLNQLQVHRFNFIADPNITVDGFLAHEAQAVVPECVTGTKDAVDDDGNPVYQGIDQSKLVPLLTAALQEALQKIETLEAKVAALEGN